MYKLFYLVTVFSILAKNYFSVTAFCKTQILKEEPGLSALEYGSGNTFI